MESESGFRGYHDTNLPYVNRCESTTGDSRRRAGPLTSNDACFFLTKRKVLAIENNTTELDGSGTREFGDLKIRELEKSWIG